MSLNARIQAVPARRLVSPVRAHGDLAEGGSMVHGDALLDRHRSVRSLRVPTYR